MEENNLQKGAFVFNTLIHLVSDKSVYLTSGLGAPITAKDHYISGIDTHGLIIESTNPSAISLASGISNSIVATGTNLLG